MTEKDKKELKQLFKETLYEKLKKTKNPKGLESLDTILRETIDEMDIDLDKVLKNDNKYFVELSHKLENMLLDKVSKAENLAKIIEEQS